MLMNSASGIQTPKYQNENQFQNPKRSPIKKTMRNFHALKSSLEGRSLFVELERKNRVF
jgi:hypothetical protein